LIKALEIKKFIILVIVCALSFFFGGFIGKNGRWLRGALSPFLETPSPPLPDFSLVRGDPQLIDFVQRQQLDIPRPDYSSKDSLTLWQESLRSKLHRHFSFPDLTRISIVPFREDSITSGNTGIIRKKIFFESFDETPIPGFLFVPPQAHRAPAILVLPGHVLEGESGIAQTSGLVESYQHSVALKLAQAGFVTLTMELRGFGELGRPFNTEHRLVAYNAILGGSFYKAVVSKDIQFAINFLQGLDQVDPHRIGITGVSYGGEMAVTYAALDERIKVVVFQGGGGAVGPMEAVVGTEADQPHYCHIIPGFNQKFYQEDLPLLIAPRPLLGVRGNQEELESTVEFEGIMGKAYRTLGSPEAFRFKKERGGHEYFVRPALEFFREFL
jgi:dienelactone hydrolase